MRIVPVPHGLSVGVSEAPRSTRLHVSDIYNDLYRRLEPNRYDYSNEAPPPILLELGFAWEAQLEKRLAADGWIRPSEQLTEEGIAYSPDLILDRGGERRVGEIKWSSMWSHDLPTSEATRFPPKLDKWITQLKVYCYHVGTNRGTLFALFLNRMPVLPELRRYDIEFAEQELREEWQMLLNHARHQGLLSAVAHQGQP